MQIRLKLMGVLKGKTPEGDSLDLPDGATIAAVLETLDVTADGVQTFFVNSKIERDPNRPLDDGDELTILPPVGGG